MINPNIDGTSAIPVPRSLGKCHRIWDPTEAMRNAGGRAYVPLMCSLPREWDRSPPSSSTMHKHCSWMPSSTISHGDMYEEIYRTADAKHLRWLANEQHLSAVLADFNEHLSGPQLEPTDLETPRIYNTPWRFLHRLRHIGSRPERPYRRTTGALDYLCGYWEDSQGRRVGGIGFVDVAEQAKIYTGTNLPKPNGRQPVQLDHILLNTPLAERVVPGSAHIHEPLDPENPDSDHKRISVTLEL